MTKKIFLAALIFIFALPAFGAVQDFGRFTVEIPVGWTATQDGDTVTVIKNNKTASVSINIAPSDGVQIRTLAETFMKELGGKNFHFDDEAYMFDITNPNGVPSNAFISGDDKTYVLIVITGKENLSDEINKIVESVTEK